MSATNFPGVRHGLRPMDGRDPHETHRVASPLELLFDLTFVISFGVAGEQFAHLLAEGHVRPGIIGFCFAMFAVVWAWVNFTWFASAYDTDDWLFRILTMVQMLGVLIVALGLPPMFHSLDVGHGVDAGVMVLGYVVMRLALVSQWVRVSRQHPERRATALSFVVNVSIAQVGWIVLWALHLDAVPFFALAAVLVVVEMAGPWVAEHKEGGTPWHAHHVAERYSLLAIIALGEILFGTVASLSAVIDAEGWTSDVILVGLAGVGLCFSIWWTYFQMPSGAALHDQREKGFRWGYGHMFIYASIAALGAGLHVVAYMLEHHSELGPVATMLTVAIPMGVYFLAMVVMVSYLVGVRSWSVPVFGAKMAILALAVVLAAVDVPLPICLLVITLAPIVSVVVQERTGAYWSLDR